MPKEIHLHLVFSRVDLVPLAPVHRVLGQFSVLTGVPELFPEKLLYGRQPCREPLVQDSGGETVVHSCVVVQLVVLDIVESTGNVIEHDSHGAPSVV